MITKIIACRCLKIVFLCNIRGIQFLIVSIATVSLFVYKYDNRLRYENIFLFFFFFLPLPLNCGIAAADTILLQPVLSRTPYFVVPMALTSRLTQLTWPNHTSIAFLHRIGCLTSSSSCSIHTLSYCLLVYSCHRRTAWCFTDN